MLDIRQAIMDSVRGLEIHGQLFYTWRQLYYEVCRTLRPWSGRLPLPFVAYSVSVPISYEDFTAALRDRVATVGPPRGLLADGKTPALALGSREPDLADYGVPSLLICQHEALAHMLIENGFHIECSIAVLSLKEATPLPEVICALLARAQAARAYFLHDADKETYESFSTLARRLLLPRGLSLESVGIRPAQVLRMHLFAKRSEASHRIITPYPASLSPREKKWLDQGWRSEVAALPPVRLIHLCRDAVLYGRIG